jgi:single-strand DNA-binding protein
MVTVNKVFLLGFLGKDPELKYTEVGTPMCRFSLATTEQYERNGEKQEKTEWHNIVVWGKFAEVANRSIRKGSKVFLEGKINTRSWEDRDGNKHNKTDIVANAISFLDPSPKKGSREPNSDQWSDDDSPPFGPAQPSAPAGASPVRDEDLPF